MCPSGSPIRVRCYPKQLTLPTTRPGIWRWWPVSWAMGLMEERGPEEGGVVVCAGGEQFGVEEGGVAGLCEFF